jgi:organic hydroperoxide reductase OsmC/OhrA
MEEHFYQVNVDWNRDRKGMMCSPELNSSLSGNGCIEVATPPEFPKGIPGIWSPEHLFTASVASCIMTTFLAIAENSNLPFSRFSCKSNGKLEKVEKRFVMTEVVVEPRVTLLHEKDRDRALRVLEKTERECLISNSIKSRVIMNPILEVEQSQPIDK